MQFQIFKKSLYKEIYKKLLLPQSAVKKKKKISLFDLQDMWCPNYMIFHMLCLLNLHKINSNYLDFNFEKSIMEFHFYIPGNVSLVGIGDITKLRGIFLLVVL